jgi:hypothetical protein
MLRVISYLLQAITAVALLCAFGIRAKIHTHENVEAAAPAPAFAGFRTAAMRWIDDDWDWGWGWSMPVRDEESIHKTWTVAAVSGSRVIEVDNVSGSIEVIGGDGNEVRMDVDKTLRAESDSALDRARKEVTLDISQDQGVLKIYVKDPTRCDGPGCWSFGHEPYFVEMNFRLVVPRNSDLTLKSVNGRGIRVRDVTGRFSLRNVNGAIVMDDVSGSGTAHTVNGRVEAKFRQSPRENCDFGSVNGAIDLYFPSNLSADFEFHTFSGSVSSDFPFAARPMNASEEHHGAVTIYRSNRLNGGRVGAGGPVIRAETLNGAIRVAESHDHE